MLALCKLFFDHLNQQGVRYCHWKSNEHLEEALSGNTDLDVLVHQDDQAKFERAMSEYDFKRILSPPDKRFSDMEDYLGFDTDTGEFVHLHVHYRLILGQKYIKNHRLPLESLFFDNLTRRQDVNIPCPEIELILLIIRAHLKVDLISLAKHAIKDMMGADYTAFPTDIEKELRALYRRRDPKKFSKLLEESGLPLSELQCSKFLERLTRNKLHFYHIMLGHYTILYRLRPYKRHSGIRVYLSYFRHYVLTLPIVKSFRTYKKKTLVGPGKIFSIVGADGSGKSTLIKDLNEWLSWKMTVRTYYYGIPKNWIAAMFSLSTRILGKLRLAPIAYHVRDLFWIYVARYRKSVSDHAANDARSHEIVITDRFPLDDFRSMNEPMDNPRIGPSRHLLGKNLRELEETYYHKIRTPDCILVLQVKFDELRRRKSDIEMDKHQLKADAVNRIEGRPPVVLINANEPYSDVLLQAKNIIWQAL